MDILSGITLLGGLAFFLYGMQVLSAGLERMAGGKLESLLKKMTASPLKSLLLGAGITAAIQSSSAVTVMLVGLVNSGILTIGQSIGVIMGSNIGTTMTSWVLTLVGIESDNIFISLLKPENFSLLFAFVGIILMMGSHPRRKDIGTILVGFAVLMYGMKLMSGAVKPLANNPAFVSMFTAFRNPILGVLAGLAITAIIQSSSASVGILQALALTGAVSYGAAIPIIMGQNIGTCVTAMLSSIGVSKNARKVAVVHVAFNLIGTAVCLTAYCAADAVLRFSFTAQPIDAVGIAVVHTAFNVITTFLLFPFTAQLERLANRVLPDTPQPAAPALLDERLLNTPSVAISECDNLTGQMAQVASATLTQAVSLLDCFEETAVAEILDSENILDRYEDELGTYLVRLSSKRLSEPDSLKVSRMLHTIGDFERLGDHAVNILHSAQELHDKGLRFSDNALHELSVLTAAIREILRLTEGAYKGNDLFLAMQVEPLEQTIDKLTAAIRARHVARLQSGECSIELGFILADLLGNLERVSDHCSNIAVAVVELSHRSFDTHRYLSEIRSDSEQFRQDFHRFSLQFSL